MLWPSSAIATVLQASLILMWLSVQHCFVTSLLMALPHIDAKSINIMSGMILKILKESIKILGAHSLHFALRFAAKLTTSLADSLVL